MEPSDIPVEVPRSDVKTPFTVSEYAALARLSRNAVYEMVRRNEVPSVRFGRAIRIPRDAGIRRLTGEA
jgi:excisionase family DNA binding protein